MKKLLTLLLFATCISANAQITFENSYPPPTFNTFLRLVKLSSSGYKYAQYDTTAITIYNLNHTLYKTINIPASAGGFGNPINLEVSYISEELFNTNPGDIEYFLYYPGTTYNGHCRVYDEAGNVLFSKDTVQLNLSYGDYGYKEFVSYTTTGYKMIVYGNTTCVYALPGTLPCNDCGNGLAGSRTSADNNIQGNILNYPNPAKNETTVAYDLPNGLTSADLVFYNITGQEVKRFKVTNAFKDILVSTADLEAGTYYYQLQAAGANSTGKKMIVIR